MILASQTPRIELLLHPRELLNLNNRQNRMAIECKDGLVWVTCPGEHQDYILRPGRRYVPETRGTIVIEAIGESRVDIEESRY